MRTNGLADPVRLLSRLLLAGNRPQPRQVHAKAPRHRLLSASVRARVRFGPPTSRSGTPSLLTPLDPQRHVLGLEVLADPLEAALAAEARLLDAAERSRGV